MFKTLKFFLCIIITSIIINLSAQEGDVPNTQYAIPWDDYVEWWYFNGTLSLTNEQHTLSLPFIFIVAHEQRYWDINEPPQHTLLTLFINYSDNLPHASSDNYILNPSKENISNFLNPDINNFSYSIPNKNTIVRKEANSFSIYFKSQNGNEMLEIQATPVQDLINKHNSYKCIPQQNIPLIAFNYPYLKYQGSVTINNIKYNIVNGIGFFDYNAWKVGWTKLIKEWFWLSAYSNNNQITFWAFKTKSQNYTDYDVRTLSIIDLKNNSIKSYCDQEISFNFKEYDDPNLATFKLTTADSKIIIDVLKNKQYVLYRPEYTDDIHFVEIKLTHNNQISYGFSFIEFLSSKMFEAE